MNSENSCCYIECTHRTWKAVGFSLFLLLSTHMLSVLKFINSRTFNFCQFSSWSYWELFIFHKLTHPQLLWSPEFPVSSFPVETRGLTCFHLKMSIYTHICTHSESVTFQFIIYPYIYFSSSLWGVSSLKCKVLIIRLVAFCSVPKALFLITFWLCLCIQRSTALGKGKMIAFQYHCPV